jgi:SagB-type dehydrogenase family enzyme
MARLYHGLSSSRFPDEWRAAVEHPLVVSGFETDVLARFPAPCKAYAAGLPEIGLPRSWDSAGGSASAVLAGRQQRPATVPRIEHLARLCHLSAGVVRMAQRSDGRYFRFRASGSAGGLFPLELYVSTRGVGWLEDGVYWFEPNGHALVRIGPPAVGQATSLVVTGVPGRTGWRYAERGLRHLYWDAGAMLANTLAVAQADGLDPRLYTVFPDRAVASLVGADGVHEFPLAIVTLGSGEPAIQAGGPAATGAVDRFEPVEFPLITATQRAGDTQRLQAPGPTAAPLAGESAASRPLEVILDRISCRRFDPHRSISRDAFERTLSVSLRGCAVPHFRRCPRR